MNFLEELEWRGLLKNASDGLAEELNKGPITAYIGYDPTAPSLTIGNLVTLMLLTHLQRHGHRPIVLMGGATGKIGDPSGKDVERQLLDYKTIQYNIEQFKKQVRNLLDFEGDNAAIVVNNADFYEGMDVFTFLRDIGKNITVNYMMSKDSVKNRIENREQGLSFTEFSYQLIQGYDFQYLYEHHGCTLQMGGSDQWGNITTGTHFVGKAGGKAYGLTCPLLTKSDGSKIGKSEGGTVWLGAEQTSPYQFYQYWINNVSNEDIPKMFKTFSLKSPTEIETLLEQEADNPRGLLQILSEELTTRIHSAEACEGAKKATAIVFSKKLKPSFLQELSKQDLAMLSKELPTFYIDRDLLEAGISVENLLADSHSSLSSKSDIRRAIKGNALSINAEKVSSHSDNINAQQLLQGEYLFVQNGKKVKLVGQLYQLDAEAKAHLKHLQTLFADEEDECAPFVVDPKAQQLIEYGYLSEHGNPITLTNKGKLILQG